MTLTTLSAADSLADKVAQWCLIEYGQNPQSLAQAVLFLPSRRAIRTMKEAFLRISDGKALLLPQIFATGDIDELLILRHGNPSQKVLEEIDRLLPEPPPMQRLMLMQEMVWRYGKQMVPRLHDREAALDLAVKLIELMDEMDREQGDWSQLESLVPEDYAQHWQQTLDFLKIIREYWPKEVQKRGWMRPWQRRNRLFELLLQCWQENPPKTPVIAAGTTGSVPAVASLLGQIIALPQGKVILPGYDTELGDLPVPDTHPQAVMQDLLAELDRKDGSIQYLDESTVMSARERFLNFSMTPVDQIVAWRTVLSQTEVALSDVFSLEAEHRQKLSLMAALLMREALEKLGKTAAFISPDRSLARAVSAQLMRWGIQVDDSAGQPLAGTPQATFLFLLIDVVRDGLKPVSLLSLLKHPLCLMGRQRDERYQTIREIEQKAMRGVAFAHWQKVKGRVAQECPQHLAFCEEVEGVLAPLLQAFESASEFAFDALLSALLNGAETLASDASGECFLWQGEGAAELSTFMGELREAALDQRIAAEELPGMLRALMRTATVRARYGTHPRLQIVSPMEARLQRYDRVILADMNEAGWPEHVSADPWMNREMRAKLGLPSADKRMGQQAHDFLQQAAGGAEVFLLRAVKSGGAETIPSRYLQRIETLASLQNIVFERRHPVLEWAEALMRPESKPPARRPAPKPPVESRPRELSVTRVERLMQDPYSIYAEKILRLKKLKALEPEPSHREFGNVVHDVLEQHFTTGTLIMSLAEAYFAQADLGYIADSLWWPRLERMAKWVEAQPVPQRIHCEVKGEWKFAAPAGEFTLTARVDRLEECAGGFSIIDYKTGSPPVSVWMKQGMANQLSLAAVIAKQGGFGAALVSQSVTSLEYWKLGGKAGGEVKVFAKEKDESFDEVVARAQDSLPKIVAAYDDADKAYESIPEYRFKPRYNDYEHLARVAEWLD